MEPIHDNSGSEDELQITGHVQRHSGRRLVSMAEMSPRKGDIKPTQFTTKKKIESTKHVSPTPIEVAQACSGDYWFQRDRTTGHQVALLMIDGVYVTQLGYSKHFQKGDILQAWLSIKVKKVSHIEYHRNSSVVLVKRSSESGTPPKLVLDFKSNSDAERFLSGFDEGVKQEVDKDGLTKKLSHAMRQAQERRSSLSTTQRDIGIQVDAQEHYAVPVLKPGIVDTPGQPEESFIKDASGETSKRTGRRLIDGLRSSINEAAIESVATKPSDAHPIMERSRRTRSEAREPRFLSPLPDTGLGAGPETGDSRLPGWTDEHPQWGDGWDQSLIFPPTGRNRATVDKDDILRLDEGEFLNDNLINFYVRYLQVKLEKERPETLKKIHVFNTFFFSVLKPTRGGISFEAVKSWTTKLDIFSYDYLVVPVNENTHWYLAIICNIPYALAGMAEENQPKEPTAAEPISPRVASVQESFSNVSLEDNGIEKQATSKDPEIPPSSQAEQATSEPQKPTNSDLRIPKIITLDSLGASHSATSKALRDYLKEEALRKKNSELSATIGSLTAKKIPRQSNFCDCGLYILGYLEEILKNPDESIRKLLSKEASGWEVNSSKLREKIRNVLFELQEQQQQRLQEERLERKRQKKRRSSDGMSTLPPSSSPVTPTRTRQEELPSSTVKADSTGNVVEL